MSKAPNAPQFSSGKPKVVVTRHLMPSVEARMSELFDAVLNPGDEPMSRDALTEAMQTCDVLVPTAVSYTHLTLPTKA